MDDADLIAEESGGTSYHDGASKYASPVGNPTNVSAFRYACDGDVSWDDYDTTPPEPPTYGCTIRRLLTTIPMLTLTTVPASVAPPVDDCECDPQDSIKNLTLAGQLDFLELMEITHRPPRFTARKRGWLLLDEVEFGQRNQQFERRSG